MNARRYATRDFTRRTLLAIPVVAAVVLVVSFVTFVHTYAQRVPPGHVLLGLIESDTTVYYSCARRWWEDGARFFYSTPYSSDPDSPRIYSHLSFILAGAVWKATDIPVYRLDQGIRFIFGISMLVLAIWTFYQTTPRLHRYTIITALAATVVACGGGLAWFLALLTSFQNTSILCVGNELPSRPLSYFCSDFPLGFAQAEDGYGDWAANLARNLPHAFECFYHTLFFAIFLCVAMQRHLLAVGFLFLTWWTHPFTGIEAGCILSAFLLFEVLIGKFHHRWLVPWIASITINALFLAYYGLYLPRFPEHASVDAQFRQYPCQMQFRMLLPGYGAFLLLLVPAAVVAYRKRWMRRPSDRLMAVWTTCVAILVFHDRVLGLSFQPMHFTRGYLHLPLVYFANRVLHHWVYNPATAPATRARTVLAAALLVFHLPDTARLFLSTQPRISNARYPFVVGRSSLYLVDALNSVKHKMSIHPLPGVSIPHGLIPLLTPHRTLVAHGANTPDHEDKVADQQRIDAEMSIHIMRKWKLDALLLTEAEAQRASKLGQFEIVPLPHDYYLARIRTGAN